MDGLTKGLVSAASLVVVAGGAYFLYGKISDNLAASAAQEARSKCLWTLHHYDVSKDEKTLQDCVVAGQLTTDELKEMRLAD